MERSAGEALHLLNHAEAQALVHDDRAVIENCDKQSESVAVPVFPRKVHSVRHVIASKATPGEFWPHTETNLDYGGFGHTELEEADDLPTDVAGSEVFRSPAVWITKLGQVVIVRGEVIEVVRRRIVPRADRRDVIGRHRANGVGHPSRILASGTGVWSTRPGAADSAFTYDLLQHAAHDVAMRR
jgi:hypothetical protein